MSERPRRLARYLHTRPSDDRVERGWLAIASDVTRPVGERRLPRVAILVAATFVVTVVALWKWPMQAAIDGAVLETAAGQEEPLELADGSRIVLEELTRLRLVKVSGRDVHMTLEKGSIQAQIEHRPGRVFAVSAGEVEIVDVGTAFRVAFDPVRLNVQVTVEHGQVRIGDAFGDFPVTLTSGGEWSSTTRTVPVAPPPAATNQAPEIRSPRPTSPPRSPRAEKLARFHSLYDEGRYADAYAVVAEEYPELAHAASVRDAFALGEAARLSGHPRHAALAFDSFRTMHRDDPRAGLAALELGRLLLGDLADPALAADTFRDAVALDPDGFFVEDARARRVEALDAAGDLAACIAARDEYVVKYPGGVHAPSVSRRCRTLTP